MNKKLIIAIIVSAALLAVMVAAIVLETGAHITISVDHDTIGVGTEEEIGIHASAAPKDGREVRYLLTPEVKGEIDRTKVGTYEITVTAKYNRAKKTEKFQIKVVDDKAPVITLQTKEGYYTLPGSSYQEEGFTAVDNYDGDLTDRVVRTETAEKVTYTVKDAAGNETTVTREIVYSDPVPPVVTLIGDAEITQERKYAFNDPGATASDNLDGDITDRITTDGEVDTATIGDYQLTYTAKDSFGNIGTANRIIHIIERTKPIGEEEEAKGKVVYLTFDDGPSAYTKKLLDVLDKYNVKVTFFVCNNGMDSMIEEEYKRGHTVAVHGWTHDYKKLYTSVDGFYENFYKMQDKIYELTGERPTLLRFPGGSSNAVSRNYCKGIMTTLTKDVEERGLHYFDWNVLSGDSEAQPISTEQVYKNVINGIASLKGKPAVVLQHDIKSFSVNAVEDIIKWGLDNGYTFLPLDETSYGAHQRLNN